MNTLVTDLNVASNKGLSERFDSTIGAGTVLMPFGGKQPADARTWPWSPSCRCSARPPPLRRWRGASTRTSSSQNQFTGAYLSVVESLAKLVAAGFEHEKAYLSFQEYFEKLRDEPERWGKPTAAVLGALMAQVDLGAGAIGGKDSMSGTLRGSRRAADADLLRRGRGQHEARHVPRVQGRRSPCASASPRATMADGLTPDKDALLEVFSAVEELTDFGDALAVSTPGYGATAEAAVQDDASATGSA